MIVMYTYNTSDFPNDEVASDSLYQEIDAATIGPDLRNIVTTPGECSIWFMDVLSEGERDTLDGVIATHSGIPLVIEEEESSGDPVMIDTDVDANHLPFTDGEGSADWRPASSAPSKWYGFLFAVDGNTPYIETMSKSFTEAGSFRYAGKTATPVNKIRVCTGSNKLDTNYEVRIYDTTNLVEVVKFTNLTSQEKFYTEKAISTDNLPDDSADFEVQYRKKTGHIYGTVRLFYFEMFNEL